LTGEGFAAYSAKCGLSKVEGEWLGRIDADPLLVVLLGGMHCYIEKQSFSLSEAL